MADPGGDAVTGNPDRTSTGGTPMPVKAGNGHAGGPARIRSSPYGRMQPGPGFLIWFLRMKHAGTFIGSAAQGIACHT
jgi:hypothetical protein